MRLVVATGNAHKVEEIKTLLAGAGWAVDVVTAAVCGGMPPVDENAGNFQGNALLKAEALRDRVREDDWILADDSGLVVDALNGEPGVHSARYAGAKASDKDNYTKLLAAMSGLASESRRARFVCVLCLIGPQKSGRSVPRYFPGECEGTIALEPEGKEGFGYDPVFIPEGYDQTFAALGQTVKNEKSHRRKAVLALAHAF